MQPTPLMRTDGTTDRQPAVGLGKEEELARFDGSLWQDVYTVLYGFWIGDINCRFQVTFFDLDREETA